MLKTAPIQAKEFPHSVKIVCLFLTLPEETK